MSNYSEAAEVFGQFRYDKPFDIDIP